MRVMIEPFAVNAGESVAAWLQLTPTCGLRGPFLCVQNVEPVLVVGTIIAREVPMPASDAHALGDAKDTKHLVEIAAIDGTAANAKSPAVRTSPKCAARAPAIQSARARSR